MPAAAGGLRTRGPCARGAAAWDACLCCCSLAATELRLRSSRYRRFMSAAPGVCRPTHTEQLKICGCRAAWLPDLAQVRMHMATSRCHDYLNRLYCSAHQEVEQQPQLRLQDADELLQRPGVTSACATTLEASNEMHVVSSCSHKAAAPAGTARTPSAAAPAACWPAPHPAARRPAAPPAAPPHSAAACASCTEFQMQYYYIEVCALL